MWSAEEPAVAHEARRHEGLDAAQHIRQSLSALSAEFSELSYECFAMLSYTFAYQSSDAFELEKKTISLHQCIQCS